MAGFAEPTAVDTQPTEVWRLTDAGWPMTNGSYSPAGAPRRFECTTCVYHTVPHQPSPPPPQAPPQHWTPALMKSPTAPHSPQRCTAGGGIVPCPIPPSSPRGHGRR